MCQRYTRSASWSLPPRRCRKNLHFTARSRRRGVKRLLTGKLDEPAAGVVNGLGGIDFDNWNVSLTKHLQGYSDRFLHQRDHKATVFMRSFLDHGASVIALDHRLRWTPRNRYTDRNRHQPKIMSQFVQVDPEIIQPPAET